MTRVLVVDDHPIVRDGIGAALGDAGIDALAFAASAREALALAGERDFDVAILDLALPDRDGESLLAQLRALRPALRVVIFSASAGRERVARLLGAGAASYVRKGTSSEELVAVVRAAARGETRLPPDVASELVDRLRAPKEEALTAREREIVGLIAAGMTNKAIAERCGIAERTVKFHVGEILARLGASNRAQAVLLARERGLI